MSIAAPTKRNFCDCCRNMGHFLCGAQGEDFCGSPIALHRQQPETYKQNVNGAPPPRKISAERPCRSR